MAAKKKALAEKHQLQTAITTKLQAIIARVPSTSEKPAEDPVARSKEIGYRAACKAALVSASLALPPGPVGWLTVLPDLYEIFRIQQQMVADIAGAFGMKAALTREHMLYCLFKQGAGQIVRALLVKVGTRVLVRRASLQVIQRILRRVGVVVTQRLVGRAVSRWIPFVGAFGIGVYTFYQTSQVADTATKLFKKMGPAHRRTGPGALASKPAKKGKRK